MCDWTSDFSSCLNKSKTESACPVSVECFRLPRISSDRCGLAVAARGATFLSNVVCSSSASSASNVNGFSPMFTERRGSFNHRCHRGGGDIIITLSPRTIITPSFFRFSGSVVSSVSSRTRFRCWSKPLSFPLRLLPPLSLTSTILPRLSSRICVVISLIITHPHHYYWHRLRLLGFSVN